MEMSECDQRLAPDAACIHECVCRNKNSRRRNLASRSLLSVHMSLFSWYRWPEFRTVRSFTETTAMVCSLVCFDKLVFFSEFIIR